MKLEGTDELAAALGKAAKWLDRSAGGMRSAGQSMMKFGIRMLGAGILLALGLLLLAWLFS